MNKNFRNSIKVTKDRAAIDTLFKVLTCGACLVGMAGFEPAESRIQSPLPYHLATSQYGAG